MSTPTDKEADEVPADFFDDLIGDDNVVEEPEEVVSDDENYSRCMAEIEKLQKDIERRKQKILKGEAELSDTERRKRRRSRSRSKNRRDRSREKETRRSRNNGKRSRSRSSSPSMGGSNRSAHRSRRDQKERSGRSRSRSPQHRAKRSTSTHRSISFLEELERKFAEKGQAFPEKDLLMNRGNLNPMVSSTTMNPPNAPIPMNFGNMPGQFNPVLGPPLMQSDFHPSMVSYPIHQPQPQPQPQLQHQFYGLNPMAVLQSGIPGIGDGSLPLPPHQVQPQAQVLNTIFANEFENLYSNLFSLQFPVNRRPEPHPIKRNVQQVQKSDEAVQAANHSGKSYFYFHVLMRQNQLN